MVEQALRISVMKLSSSALGMVALAGALILPRILARRLSAHIIVIASKYGQAVAIKPPKA